MSTRLLRVGGEFLVNTYTASRQVGPATTKLSDGRFVVTWMSEEQDSEDKGTASEYAHMLDKGIYGQIYNPDGSPQGSEFQVPKTTASNQKNPELASLSDGGFVVSWMSYEVVSGNYKSYAQIYNADGTIRVEEFRADDSSGRFGSELPAVTGLSGGGFVITWASRLNGSGDLDVFAQIYESDGSKRGGEFQVNTYMTSDQERPSISSLADGGFVAVWQSDFSYSDIICQVYNTDGSVRGSEFKVNIVGTKNAGLPSVTGLSDGGFVVSWGEGGIRAQIYNSDGSPRGEELLVYTFLPLSNSLGSPSIDKLSDGGFVVTWEAYESDGSDYGVLGRAYNADGTPRGGDFQINTTTDKLQNAPSVTSLEDGSFFVTWQSQEQIPSQEDPYGYDIYGQMFRWNIVPEGNVEISGVFTAGQILTVDTSGLSDTDGLSSYSYQWLRDGLAISGAVASTYELRQQDIDAAISIRVSYFVGNGTWESITSDTTPKIADNGLRLIGTSNPERMDGDSGSDFLDGRDGNDSLYGFEGNDTLYGGSGNDTLSGFEGDDMLYGGSGNDVLGGADGEDNIFGGFNHDTIWAGAGNDTVFGGDGRDVAHLGAGADLFVDNDQDGVLGSDTVFGNQGNDTIEGGGADDEFHGDLGNDVIRGRLGDDMLYGGDGFDTLDSGDGNDSVWGGNGRDMAVLGNGNDIFLDNGQAGDFGRDTVYAGLGDDTIQGGNGNDVFLGQAGHDLMFGRVGADQLYGGDGFDTLDSGDGNDSVWGGNGRDKVFLGNNNDVFFDNGQGGALGQDTVFGGAGFDTINGGAGNDVFHGDKGNDKLFGANGDDKLYGGDHDDRLYGGDGVDSLWGGNGLDQIWGGAGFDTFFFADGFGKDTVFGFEAADGEKISLAGVSAITDFADLLANHLSNVGGTAQIVDGANTILLNGVSFGDVGVGLAYSADDFLF